MHRRSTGQFVRGAMGAAVVLAVLWGVIVWSLAGRAHVHNQWVAQAMAHKLAIAAAVDGPRVLVVAGSGAMFGIDSGMLGDALGRPVVNLGVNAGVLAPYIIEHARQALRPGDWVILPLEYPLFHDEGMTNRQFIDFYVSHPLPAAQIGLWRWVKLLWSVPVERVLQGYRGLPEGFVVGGLYGPHNLDARGDQMHSARALRSDAMWASVVHSAPEAYGRRAWWGNASWARWRGFADEVHALGGCAVFVPAAMLMRETYLRDDVEHAYYASLPAQARQHGLMYVGAPLDFMYEADSFFDTNFHLTSEMRAVHTGRLAALLKPVMDAECRQTRGERP